ncbi:Assists the folding of proteins upon ATP hydrolysis [Homalodisca vitripennis]|nr:Assists the folding of proteins upon ATP hydrolysis [Homalodisca vitripennis]
MNDHSPPIRSTKPALMAGGTRILGGGIVWRNVEVKHGSTTKRRDSAIKLSTRPLDFDLCLRMGRVLSRGMFFFRRHQRGAAPKVLSKPALMAGGTRILGGGILVVCQMAWDVTSGVCKRLLRLKCMAVGRPTEEEEPNTIKRYVLSRGMFFFRRHQRGAAPKVLSKPALMAGGTRILGGGIGKTRKYNKAMHQLNGRRDSAITLSTRRSTLTSHFSGLEEAVFRNISACKQFAETVRTAYGPNGMNKIIINHIEKLFVTNDAATIIKELEVEHPAAKLMIMASEMQEKEIGDGTNFVIIFSGALLEAAEDLLRMLNILLLDGSSSHATYRRVALPRILLQWEWQLLLIGQTLSSGRGPAPFTKSLTGAPVKASSQLLVRSVRYTHMYFGYH